MKGHPFLYGLIFLMVVLWAANFIVGKVALREFPPLLLCGLRVTLAGLLMLPVYWWEGLRRTDRWGREDLPLLLFLGLFGVALNQLCFVMGLSSTTVAHSAIIISAGPVLVLLFGASMGQEKITRRKIAGMLIAIGGVAVLKIFQSEPVGGPRATWLGDTFIFLSSVTFALFAVFGKRASRRHSSITVNAFAYVSGAVVMAPMTLWKAGPFAFGNVSALGWVCLFYMAMFPSVLCYMIFYYAITHIPASRVVAFTYLQPLLATAMALAVLHEHVTLPVVVAGLTILAGVYLAERG